MSITGSFIFVFLVLLISKSETASRFEIPYQGLSLTVSIKEHTKNEPECTERYLRSLSCVELIYLTKQVNYLHKRLLCLSTYIRVYGHTEVNLDKFDNLVLSELSSLGLEKHQLVSRIFRKSCLDYVGEIDLTPLETIETSHLKQYDLPFNSDRHCRGHVQLTLLLLRKKHKKLEKAIARSKLMEIRRTCLYTYFENLTALTMFSMNVISVVLEILCNLYPKEVRCKSYQRFLLSQGNCDTSSSSSEDSINCLIASDYSSSSILRRSTEKRREDSDPLEDVSTKGRKRDLSEKQTLIRKFLSGISTFKSKYCSITPKETERAPFDRGKSFVYRGYIPTPGYSDMRRPLDSKGVKEQSEIMKRLQRLPLEQAILELNINDSSFGRIVSMESKKQGTRPVKQHSEHHSRPVKQQSEHCSRPVKQQSEHYSRPVKQQSEHYSRSMKQQTEHYSRSMKQQSEHYSRSMKQQSEHYSRSMKQQSETHMEQGGRHIRRRSHRSHPFNSRNSQSKLHRKERSLKECKLDLQEETVLSRRKKRGAGKTSRKEMDKGERESEYKISEQGALTETTLNYRSACSTPEVYERNVFLQRSSRGQNSRGPRSKDQYELEDILNDS